MRQTVEAFALYIMSKEGLMSRFASGHFKGMMACNQLPFHHQIFF